jgi:hypothetical protein
MARSSARRVPRRGHTRASSPTRARCLRGPAPRGRTAAVPLRTPRPSPSPCRHRPIHPCRARVSAAVGAGGRERAKESCAARRGAAAQGCAARALRVGARRRQGGTRAPAQNRIIGRIGGATAVRIARGAAVAGGSRAQESEDEGHSRRRRRAARPRCTGSRRSPGRRAGRQSPRACPSGRPGCVPRSAAGGRGPRAGAHSWVCARISAAGRGMQSSAPTHMSVAM